VIDADESAAARHAPAGRAGTGQGSGRRYMGLSRLLDRADRAWWLAFLIAAGLGMLHALEPGHGKTLASAWLLGSDARAFDPVILSLSAGLAHTAVILLAAVGLWLTGSSEAGGIHRGLAAASGLGIAIAGAWRLGRVAGGHEGHGHGQGWRRGRLGLVGLGAAAGLVPCWEAVGLLVLAAAIGRLRQGVLLVLAYSLGTTLVLLLVSGLAWRIQASGWGGGSARIGRISSALGGLAALAVGLILFLG